jgi:hypothetical protein
MADLNEFIMSLPKMLKPEDYGVYPFSINEAENTLVFMAKKEDGDCLIAVGENQDFFTGELRTAGNKTYVEAPLNHQNAVRLRKIFPFTAPTNVLQKQRTFGVGDRLGIACPGHIKVFKEYDAYPVFAQQSIRELRLTNRTFADVLDSVTFSVYREGYKFGFGADGDHLKKAEEVEDALNNGFTMITLDCSEHIRSSGATTSLPEELKAIYLGKTFTVEGMDIVFDVDELKQDLWIYGSAIDFVITIYREYIKKNNGINFEISIDETQTPTTPAQHFFVANELIRRGVKMDTVAPRFCGEFQKGIDYIGDIKQFEEELKVHAAIARHFGYKLSIHSGSDKFSIFPLIGKYTQGQFHVKTAGTNWLEAMRVIAGIAPGLYREIHQYALEVFDDARKYYHITPNLERIPKLADLKDEELVNLFLMNDARQLIHITYGHILNARDENGNYRFRDQLYRLWFKNQEVYAHALSKHIGRHLELLYSGFRSRD